MNKIPQKMHLIIANNCPLSILIKYATEDNMLNREAINNKN